MRKSDPDMYGSVEDRGYDSYEDGPVIRRNGINRQQYNISYEDPVMTSGPRKPNAQRPNLRSDATKMTDSYQ